MLSRIYAGTGALKSSYTRNGKLTMFGVMDDMYKNVNRLYVSTFQDKTRQEGIDLLLGKTYQLDAPLLANSMHSLVLGDMNTHAHKFSTFEKKRIFIGTYNLNGKLPGKESLDSWLVTNRVGQADLVVIGVQELIELSPGAYITTDTDKLRLIWENAIMRSLNRAGSTYVILRSIHLVALGMFAFVTTPEVTNIRALETCAVKTGLMGMAANKGGIGISLMYNDTSLAFITAHFAAGNDAVEERNRDYWTITNGMNFRGKLIANHEYSTSNKALHFGLVISTIAYTDKIRMYGFLTQIRSMVNTGDIAGLIDQDQLREQCMSGAVFSGFAEGKIVFDPTYKYDNESTSYDTRLYRLSLAKRHGRQHLLTECFTRAT
jgi:synaptojanin